MNVARNEIRTGLFVVASLSLLSAVLIYVGAPGLFRPQMVFSIYFDNAGGLQEGTPVMLAGRRVGQVIRISSPVPPAEQPRKDLYAVLEVSVRKDSRIYKDSKVYMMAYSLLGEDLIDFTDGSEAAGLAPDQHKFIGVRKGGLNDAAPHIVDELRPVTQAAVRTVEELEVTAKQLTKLTKESSDLVVSISNFKALTGNLLALSGTDGSVKRILDNVEGLTTENSPLIRAFMNLEQFTGNIAANKDIDLALGNIRKASETMKTAVTGLNTTVNGLNGTVTSIRPGLRETIRNTTQMTDTLKRQPWRLVWPSTKKYPEDQLVTQVPMRVGYRPAVAPSPVAERRSPRADRSATRSSKKQRTVQKLKTPKVKPTADEEATPGPTPIPFTAPSPTPEPVPIPSPTPAKPQRNPAEPATALGTPKPNRILRPAKLAKPAPSPVPASVSRVTRPAPSYSSANYSLRTTSQRTLQAYLEAMPTPPPVPAR